MSFHDHTLFASDDRVIPEAFSKRADKHLKESMIRVSNQVGQKHWEDLFGKNAVVSDLINVLQLAKEKGMSKKEAVKLAKTFKNNVSYTWHPTNNLSEAGTKLRLKQIEAFEDPDVHAVKAKASAIRQEIKDSDDLTPKQKATMIDEMDANLAIADRDNKGANFAERRWEQAIHMVWGGKRPDLSMNLAGRSWIFDADGKNNNEGWAMISALTTLKKAMFEELLEALDDQDLIDRNPELMQLRENIHKVLTNLAEVNTLARHVTKDIASVPVSEREAYFKRIEGDFKNSLSSLRSLYAPVGDDLDDRGHNFFLSTVKTLKEVRKREGCHWDDDSKLDNAFRTLRRNGFTLQKGQTRHNGIVYSNMMDNLFAHDEFLNSKFLRDRDRKLLETVNGKFSDLTDKQQRMLVGHLSRQMKGHEVRLQFQKLIIDANPMEFSDSNGYPTSGAAMADRLKIASIFRRNFAEFIISDAGSASPSHQNFFANAFGMPDIKSMALNEDQKTLQIQAKIAMLFHREGGAQDAAKKRKEGAAALYSRGPDNEIRIMIPSSDSMRNGGPGTLLQMCNTIRKATKLGIKMNIPIEIMLGSGGSMGRFGCDQAMVRRIVAQTIQNHVEKRGYPLDPDNSMDSAAFRMLQVVMHTEQGRMPNILSGTIAQIGMRNLSRTMEMFENVIELTGLVKKGTYIEPLPKFSKAMKEKVKTLHDDMIANFSNFRFAVSEKTPDREPAGVLNSMARKVMFPNLASFINHGARPAAKGKSKEITDVRAIENDKRKALAELFDSSFYSSGAMMADMHASVHSGDISATDVKNLVDHPQWNFFIFAKGVTEAMRFEATKKFEKLSGSAGNWDFDKAIEIGKSVKLEEPPKGSPEGTPHVMHFDDRGGTISREEAYLAKIYYDRAQFLALTEATLKGKLDQDLDTLIKKMRPEDGSLEFGPGKRTLKEWPVAQEVYDLHQKNAKALEMMHDAEDYFAKRLDEGATEEEIIVEFGGEENLRKICSAYMEGALSHFPFWWGECNYGKKATLKSRQDLRNANDNNPNPDYDMRLEAA